MHKEDKDEKQRQENILHPPEPVNQVDELSDVWRELLGKGMHEASLPPFLGDAPIPKLEVDPWSALLQAKGVELVDLHHMHLRISDQEVEQLLEVMPDDPDSREDTVGEASAHVSSHDVLDTDADGHTGA
jgi:hypothetical protein